MQSYRIFLLRLHDSLVDCLAQGENEEWHHAPASSERHQVYLRVLTQLAAVEERILWYGNTTKSIRQRAFERGKFPTAEDAVAGYQLQHNLGERLAASEQLISGDLDSGYTGYDIGEDADST